MGGCLGGLCTRFANDGLCPDSVGCRISRCTGDPFDQADGRLGCDVIPNVTVCTAMLPPDNECLVPRCEDDGSCTFTPTNSQCTSPPPDLPCPPGEVAAICNPEGKCVYSCIG